MFLSVATLSCTTAAIAQSTPALPFEARVEAQRSIEQVYWQQRLWPGADARPALEEVMPAAAIEAKVTDYLKKSAALEQIWQRPITRHALQAELDRMVRATRAPETLRSLFAALDNDGYVIAETLVRQKLVDRMLRSRYASDPQLHVDIRRQAKQALAASTSADDWILRGAEHSVITIARSDDSATLMQPASTTQLLDSTQWDDAVHSLSQRLGADLPTGVWSALSDETTGFEIVRVQDAAEGTLTVESVRWPKQNFDQWWSGMNSELAPDEGGAPQSYTAGVPQGSCTSGEWGALPTAPQGRRGHTAVWTGSEMLVWGGKGMGFADLDSGGVYNPTADSWSATSLSQAPKACWEHTAVWSGSEMLIFGGESDNASFLADGGRLCALDTDADGALDELDCSEADGSIWSAPGEVGMLSLSGSAMTEISWSAPVDPGSADLTYDVLRADGAEGFMSPMCVATDTTSTSAGDPSPPAPGNAYYYLVVAKNECGTSLGAGSDGDARQTLDCN